MLPLSPPGVARTVSPMVERGTRQHRVARTPTAGASRTATPGAAAPSGSSPAAGDSRVARGGVTRLALLEAVVTLVVDGGTHPSAAEVARQAGVSSRTVHYHFAGIHGLLVAAAAHQAARHRHLLTDVPPVGPAATRITALCRQRRAYYEALTPVLLAALARSPGGPGLDVLLDEDRAAQRGQLARTLAPELGARNPALPDLLDALVFATGWDAWRYLRLTTARSAAGAERVMALTAYRLVFPAG